VTLDGCPRWPSIEERKQAQAGAEQRRPRPEECPGALDDASQRGEDESDAKECEKESRV
jgi:hypothetical protein